MSNVMERNFVEVDKTMDTVKIERIYGDYVLTVTMIGSEIYEFEREELFI